MASEFHASSEAEFERYMAHQNDVTDPGYRNFVAPVVDAVFQNFGPDHEGLDFGAGPGPVAAHLLNQKGMYPKLYDPYFYPDRELLLLKYDYIICCEVVEHFNHPREMFRLLFELLKPEGLLFIMTNLLTDEIDFERWYYKNDFTHVFFYNSRTFAQIERLFGFQIIDISGRMVILKRPKGVSIDKQDP